VAWRAPKTITHDVIERLNAVALAGAHDSHILEQIAFQAGRLRSQHLFDYHMIMGMISSLKGDAAEVREHYLRARELPTCDLDQLFGNFSVSFVEAGDVPSTAELAGIAMKSCKGNRALLDALGTLMLRHGYIDLFDALTDETETASAAQFDNDVKWAVAQIRARGVSSEDATTFLAHVTRFLRSRGITRGAFMCMPMEAADSPGPCMILRLSVPLDAEHVIALEDELFDATFGKQFRAFDTDAILIQFTSEGTEANGDKRERLAPQS
jgi:hypothetical protein